MPLVTRRNISCAEDAAMDLGILAGRRRARNHATRSVAAAREQIDASHARSGQQVSGEDERAAIVAWLRKSVGMEAGRMILAAGLPGGTKTQRVKSRAYAEGCAHAVSSIIKAIERGDHLLHEG